MGGATGNPASAARGFVASVPAVYDARKNQIAYLRVGVSDSIPTRADIDVSDWPHDNADQTQAVTEIRDMHFTNNGELQIVALFDVDQANVPAGGAPRAEVGLYTRGFDNAIAVADNDPNADTVLAGYPGSGSRLFARQIHAPVSKTNEFQLEYTWTILFN